MVTCDKVEVELFLLIELLNGIESVNVARCLNANDVRVFSEDLITDGIFVLTLFIHGPVHLDELTRFERPARDGTPLELLDEGHDVDNIKDVSLYCADCIFEGRKG